jgi:hypothetical protein
MFSQSIQAELRRLNVHPVNLDVASQIDDSVLLKGSLLKGWPVPKSINAEWFLKLLAGLPDNAGPQKTMDAFDEACSAQSAGAV